jgi:hypothetical protein
MGSLSWERGHPARFGSLKEMREGRAKFQQ